MTNRDRLSIGIAIAINTMATGGTIWMTVASPSSSHVIGIILLHWAAAIVHILMLPLQDRYPGQSLASIWQITALRTVTTIMSLGTIDEVTVYILAAICDVWVGHSSLIAPSYFMFVWAVILTIRGDAMTSMGCVALGVLGLHTSVHSLCSLHTRVGSWYSWTILLAITTAFAMGCLVYFQWSDVSCSAYLAYILFSVFVALMINIIGMLAEGITRPEFLINVPEVEMSKRCGWVQLDATDEDSALVTIVDTKEPPINT